MFDLIGFWGSVSVVCFVALYGVFVSSIAILDCYITKVTGGEVKYSLTKRVPKAFSLLDEAGDIRGASGVGLWASSVALTVLGCNSLESSTTLVEIVYNISTVLTPFFSIIAPVILLLFLLDMVIKKGYHYSKLLKSLDKTNK
jgi:hypothetical protein